MNTDLNLQIYSQKVLKLQLKLDSHFSFATVYTVAEANGSGHNIAAESGVE